MPPPVSVRPVSTRADRGRFLRLPWIVYRDDPHWIPPLLVERRMHLAAHNPYFRHAEWQSWLAWRDGTAVGRITAQIDGIETEHRGERIGHFGMIEAIDDAGVFAALLAAAEEWLGERGCRRITGPFNLSINQECGLLVAGFDTPPSLMMGHARPWHDAHVQAAGYTPAKDLLAYRIAPDFDAPRLMEMLIRRHAARVTVRAMDRRNAKRELGILRDLFNDAWQDNWGFVPFTPEEFDEIGTVLTWLADPDFVQIAELDGQPVAMIVALPNLNEAARDLDGRLLPFGWLKLLWRLKWRHPRSARVPLMGVRHDLQHTPAGPALAFLVIDAVRKALIRRGVREVELSWILEDNAGMRHIIEAIGGEAYKRYRVYAKPS